MQRVSGQLLRSLLQNPRNFSEVAPEVRPAVHTAALRLNLAMPVAAYQPCHFWKFLALWNGVRGRGCDEAEISEEKCFFTE